MSNGDEEVCGVIRAALEQYKILKAEKDIQNATQFVVKSGPSRATILVYSTGKIVVPPSSAPLRDWLITLKDSVESGFSTPGTLLPPEIEELPAALKQRVPAVDGVVLWYFEEALRCFKSGSPAGAAFLLGVASEKAILLLIETYGDQIIDTTKKDRFLSRLGKRMISAKYDEFCRSYKSAKTKPTPSPRTWISSSTGRLTSTDIHGTV